MTQLSTIIAFQKILFGVGVISIGPVAGLYVAEKAGYVTRPEPHEQPGPDAPEPAPGEIKIFFVDSNGVGVKEVYVIYAVGGTPDFDRMICTGDTNDVTIPDTWTEFRIEIKDQILKRTFALHDGPTYVLKPSELHK